MIGRTARIGNEGLATSFYNDDRDSGLAADLVKLLMESNQAVPDFLESFRPSEATLSFDDDSTDGEDEDVKKDETRGWAPDSGNDVSAYDELAEKEPALRQSGYITDENDVGW